MLGHRVYYLTLREPNDDTVLPLLTIDNLYLIYDTTSLLLYYPNTLLYFSFLRYYRLNSPAKVVERSWWIEIHGTTPEKD